MSGVHDVLLGLAITAATVAAVPIFARPWIKPYESKPARWTVYSGALVALALFIVLSRG